MVTYLKHRIIEKTSKAAEKLLRKTVEDILDEIEMNGDEAVRAYSTKFDNWSPSDYRLSHSEIERITASLPATMLDDIRFSHQQVRRFAENQRQALRDIEVETLPGVFLGHKNIPVDSVGCYIPGGSYPLLSSAAMNIIPARVAGVKRIVACTPPLRGQLPEISIAAMALAGADEIFILGGVQAIAAMGLGTKTIQPVDMIVGPGNSYVAEAKRQLFGRVGIDLIAGPSEVLVIADDSVDAEIVAADLVGQAEHGINSPCILLTTCEKLATGIEMEVLRQLEILPTSAVAAAAWRDYGEVIFAADDEEMVIVANRLAFEHVEVLTRNPQFYLDRLTQYGSLFLGPETCVPYGDFVIGTNHTLPTNGAARYTGGLWVGKYIKTVTYQKCTPEGSVQIGHVGSRLAEFEGCFGHQAQIDLRLRRYSHPE